MNKPAKKKQLISGDMVTKTGADYRFTGQVVAVFRKIGGGQVRYVVENSDGILKIFKPTEVVALDDPDTDEGTDEGAE